MVCNEIRDIEDFNLKDKEHRKAHGMHYAAFAWQNIVENITRTTNKRILIKQKNETNGLVAEDNRTMLFAYLSQHPCVDCGETDAHVLEFDHVKGKESNNISKMVMWTVTPGPL